MAITTKPVRQSIELPSWLTELSFIPIISDWLELLAARLAQPTMFFASLWIIAETTVPGANVWWPWLNTLSMTVMSMAPEVISPGCFIQARRATKEERKQRAKLLYGLFVTCLALLGATLAINIWKLAVIWPWTMGLILFIRCSVGIAYTIILKVDKENGEIALAQPAQPASTPDDLVALIAAAVENAVTPLRTELRGVQVHVHQLVQDVRVEEVAAQSPNAIEISCERPSARPAIAQRSVSSEMSEEDTGEQPIAQQPTQPVHAIQGDIPRAILAYLDASPDPEQVTDAEVMAAIPGSTKSQARRYRGEHKKLRGAQ